MRQEIEEGVTGISMNDRTTDRMCAITHTHTQMDVETTSQLDDHLNTADATVRGPWPASRRTRALQTPALKPRVPGVHCSSAEHARRC